jgi:regulator of sirC expression with transglutaminase-like and TPR domain
MAKDVNSDLTNLMDLLDEQDDSLFEKISETILSYGVTAIPFLENISENSLDDLVQSRAMTLISKIKIHNLYSELHNWATLDSNDLLKGFFIISKYQFPGLDEEVVMAKVEALKKEVWLELKKGMTPFEETKVISKVFFEVRKFSLNHNPASMPDCVCLNAVLNSGKGYPEAFAMLYTGIAQRLGIPVYGVQMPDSMFVAYVYSEGNQSLDLRKDVRFYINPFAAGVFFQVKQIEEHLQQTYPDDIERYSGACTNPEFIQRILIIIKDHYIRKNRPDKAEDIKVLMKALNVE